MTGRRAVLKGALGVLAARPAWAGEPSFGRPALAGAVDLETPLAALDRLITPVEAFFVRSHFGPPRLVADRALTIDGEGARELRVTAAELAAMPQATVTAVLQCAGNGRALHAPRVPGVQWRHGAMGQAEWRGVRLHDLLARAGVARAADGGAAFVRLAGADRPPNPKTPAFVRSIPLARALEPDAIVATHMNGAPLGRLHGAPMRLVVPVWAGDHWMKWLTHVRVQRDEAEGFYSQTAYKMPIEPVEPGALVPPAKMRALTTFPVRSVIARPVDGRRLPAKDPIDVVGVAFSGEAPLAKVEVSADGGRTWARASLEGPPGVGRWQVFRHRVAQGPAGTRELVARATDARGAAQPERAPWNPSGYFWNGWHRVAIEVTA